MPRHGDNIRKRKDGRWEARILLPHRSGEKATYKYIYAYTLKEVQEKKNQYIALIYHKIPSDSGSECMVDDSSISKGKASVCDKRNMANVEAGACDKRNIENEETGACDKRNIGNVEAEACDKRNMTNMEAPKDKNIDNPENTEMTFQAFAQIWLQSKLYQVKESTYSRYHFILQKHILPYLGQEKLRDLNTKNLSDFIRQKSLPDSSVNSSVDSSLDSPVNSSALAPKSVSDIRTLLLQVIYYAVEQGQHPGLKGRIYSPGPKPVSVSIYSQHEIQQLQSYIQLHPDSTTIGIQIALLTGLRIGELCALTWQDINMEKRVLQVCHTLQRIQKIEADQSSKTKIIVGVPKTLYAIRQIPITDQLYRNIENYMHFLSDSNPANPSEALPLSANHYLLSNSSKPVEPRLFLSRYKTILRKAGLSDHTFHEVRHTFASTCIRHGMDVKMLSEILGHSSVTITLQRYVHPSMEDKMAEMEKVMVGNLKG